jgi:hypothetical protein
MKLQVAARKLQTSAILECSQVVAKIIAGEKLRQKLFL